MIAVYHSKEIHHCRRSCKTAHESREWFEDQACALVVELIDRDSSRSHDSTRGERGFFKSAQNSQV